MALKLFAPGYRNSATWLVYGKVEGRKAPVSQATGCTTKRQAEAWFREQLKPGGILYEKIHSGAAVKGTFEEAAKDYAIAKDIDLEDPQDTRRRAAARDINRLIEKLGRCPLSTIDQTVLHRAAHEIFPQHQAETRNRHVLKPALAIINAFSKASNGKLPRINVAMFPEKEPAHRAVGRNIDDLLLAAIPAGPRSSAPGSSIAMRRLVILWFLRQGTRISDALKIEWSKIDLERQSYKIRIGKRKKWRDKALDPEIVEALQTIPEQQRTGNLFPWQQKSAVYRWLRPLVRELGITFTPHMGRHSVGTRLNENGAGLATIMETLDHADPRSSLRYQDGDIEIQRQALHTEHTRRKGAQIQLRAGA